MDTAGLSNPFLDDDEEIVTSERKPPKIATAGDGIPAVGDRINYEDISRQLILDGFILTALELHTELQEIGKPVSFLKDYFSNPGNFERTKPPDIQSTSPPVGLQRSGSIQTFDSLDWARYSDDGDRQAEDRVAGLEFELRKAQDTIKSLRKALTIATESSNNSEVASEQTSSTNTCTEYSADTIKPHQRRAINFLVNEYLLLHDYKLTSITFAEENENQDFEHWDDVGLNISKPPDLLHLYLDFGKHTAPVVDTHDESTCDDFYKEETEAFDKKLQRARDEIEFKEREITSINMENQALTTDIEILKLENNTLVDKLEELKHSAPVPSQPAPPPVSTDESSDAVDGPMARNEPPSPHTLYSYQLVDREIPAPFLNHILSLSYHVPEDNRIAQQVSHIDGNNIHTIIDMIAKSIPHIVPNVLLAKREELLPLILCAANLHQSTKARDSLLNTLFNLIKKPDELQRQMILTGCIMFAQYNGPGRVEEELLPQCWEQINDKHTERRLLVVNACCALIPYMSISMRASLVLSMLQQMLLDEKVPEIRAAIVRSLGILVCFVDDTDKFSQILNLYGRHILPDSSVAVQEEAVKILLPSLALWSVHIDRVADVTELLLAALQNSLAEPNEENEIKVIPELFLPAIKHLHKLIKFQFISLLYSGPYRDKVEVTEQCSTDNTGAADLDNPCTLVPDIAEYRQLWVLYNEHTSEEWYKTWDQFDLLVYTVFSRLSMLALSIHSDDYKVVKALVSYVQAACTAIGQRVTADKIEPKLNELFKYEGRITSQQHKVYTSALLPMLVCGVKAAFHEPTAIADLVATFHKFIVSMAESEVPTQSLEMALSILLDDTEFVEPILDSLLELVMDTTSTVRISCARFFEVASKSSSCSALINKKILPGLVTLACGPDNEVKVSTISAFGSVLEMSEDTETTERIYTEFRSLLLHTEKTRDLSMQMSMIGTFIKIGPNIEPQFREDVVLSQLSTWSKENNRCGDTIRRRDVALKLMDAYCALSCCFISSPVLREYFLPGLKALLVDYKELALEGASLIQSMIRDIEVKIGEDNSNGRLGTQGAVSQAMSVSSPPQGSPMLPRNRSMLNKIMEKSAPNKMTNLFSKRK